MQVIHGHVVEVKTVRTQGVTRILIDVPIESYVDTVKLVHDARVMLSPANEKASALPYGVYSTEELADDADFIDIPDKRITPVPGQIEHTSPKKAPPEKGPHGDFYAKLHQRSFFLAPKVWRACGTDKDFRAFVQLQPSAYSGTYNETTAGGERKCVAAHFHIDEDGEFSHGTSIKADYSCIPLTQDEHHLQHQEGYEAIMPIDWWKKQRVKYASKWAEQALKQFFDVESFTMLDPAVFLEWVKLHGLENYIR